MEAVGAAGAGPPVDHPDDETALWRIPTLSAVSTWGMRKVPTVRTYG
jgi:hypothetical protein